MERRCGACACSSPQQRLQRPVARVLSKQGLRAAQSLDAPLLSVAPRGEEEEDHRCNQSQSPALAAMGAPMAAHVAAGEAHAAISG